MKHLSTATINQHFSWAALVAGIVYLGVYWAEISWYWLLPASHTSHPPTQVVPESAGRPDKEKPIDLTITLASITQYNPWGEIPKPDVAVVEKPVVKPVEKAVASSLNVELVGTMVQEGMQSVAFLVDLGGRGRASKKGRQQMMYVGDQIQGAELEKIERNAVYLRNGTRLELVRLKSELLDREELLPDRLKSIQKSSKQVSRREWHQAIDQGVSLLRGLEITPYYQGRHSIGYRVNIIAQRPIYQRVGIASGDIIKSVNGISVMQAKEILASIPQLKNESIVEIEVLRNHQAETLAIHIGE